MTYIYIDNTHVFFVYIIECRADSMPLCINAGQYLVAFLFYFITSVFVIFFFGQHERAKNKHHIPVLFQPKLMMFCI